MSREVPIGEHDAWITVGISAVAFALLLGLLQVGTDDLDLALSISLWAIPIALVPSMSLGVRYRIIGRSDQPRLPAKTYGRISRMLLVAGLADVVAVGGLIAHLSWWAAILYVVLVLVFTYVEGRLTKYGARKPDSW